jgi:hypothetical protein
MRQCNYSPYFATVGEVAEFVEQVLEVSALSSALLFPPMFDRDLSFCTARISLIGTIFKIMACLSFYPLFQTW